MAEHVTINGADYCITGSGIAARVTLSVTSAAGGLLTVTDDVIRASWLLGGAWDSGRSPWYTPTPNPVQIDLETDDPRWNPFAVDFYNPVPLQSIVTVWLAERDTTPGVWATAMRARGLLLEWRVEPIPGGGKVRVILDAVDSTTSMADATIGERAEESCHARLTYLIGRTVGLQSNVSTGIGGPLIGRVHPSQNMMALDHAVDVALAAGHVLVFQPHATATPAVHTLVSTVAMASLGAPGGTFTASTNPPTDGPGTPGSGSTPILGAGQRAACIDAVVLAKSDAGFRTRIEASRDVAYWLQQTWDANWGPKPPGVHGLDGPPAWWDIGDTWTLTYNAGVNWTGAVVPFLRTYVWDGAAVILADDRPWTTSGQWWNTAFRLVGFRAGTFNMGLQLHVASGSTATPTVGEIRIERAAGSGPTVTYIATTAVESVDGIRALAGFKSPIARQPDLTTWMQQALAWRTTPRKLNANELRVSSTSTHQSPGSRQWAVYLQPTARVALNLPNYLAVWVVGIRFTLDPDAITLDVTCAPPSDPY